MDMYHQVHMQLHYQAQDVKPVHCLLYQVRSSSDECWESLVYIYVSHYMQMHVKNTQMLLKNMRKSCGKFVL